jgi:hypothetical protein
MDMKLGPLAFMIGLVLAGLLGLFNFDSVTAGLNAYVTMAVVLLGAVVGFINITNKESMKTLLAGIVIGVGSAASAVMFSAVPIIGPVVISIFSYALVVVMIAALKTILTSGKN